jgi:hypothetical protein
MKLTTLLLVGSLAVNAAVISLYVTQKPAASTVSPTEKSASRAQSAPAATSPETQAAAQTALLGQAWTQLQSGDLKTLVARLKAAGFSPSMIRAIVAAQVNEQFSARRKELLSGQEEQPFWKSSRNVFMDPKTLAALRDLGKEQTALMKSLLGSDGVPGNEEMNAWQRRQFGNLPAEKLTQLQSINSDYAELQQEIYAKSKGVILAEDREKLAFLEKEKLADIAKTLTPQELEDFQLRTSNTANQLRNQLTTFNATEAEFRALYKAASGVDEKFGSNIGFRNPADYQARQAALLAAAQTALSPERFAEYKQAADPQYQQINRLVARLELPAATSQQVVALQQDIQTRARAIQTNRDLPAADRTTQLEALQAEATAKLTTSLTARGLAAYKENGGYWLENLKPRPMPAAPAAGGSSTTQPAVRLPGG